MRVRDERGKPSTKVYSELKGGDVFEFSPGRERGPRIKTDTGHVNPLNGTINTNANFYDRQVLLLRAELVILEEEACRL